MHMVTSVRRLVIAFVLGAGAAAPPPDARAREVTVLVDANGSGPGNGLVRPWRLGIDAAGNTYVPGQFSDNAFRIAPDGTITEIIDASGDGVAALDHPTSVAVGPDGSVYVTGSNNVFRSSPGGPFEQIIGPSDGLIGPSSLAFDSAGNLFVNSPGSDAVLRRTPGGTISTVIDGTGDGAGNTLSFPSMVVVDAADNLYVSGAGSSNVFKVTPGGTITEMADATGDGTHALNQADALAVDTAGNVYVSGFASGNVFRISPVGAVELFLDSSGTPVPLGDPRAIGVGPDGEIYVAGGSDVFRVGPSGVVDRVVTSSPTRPLSRLLSLAVDASGRLYLVASENDLAVRVTLTCPVVPRSDCAPPGAPGKSTLAIKQRLFWKWTGGPAILPADLGDPSTTDRYQVCIYHGIGAPTGELTAPVGALCGSRPCWKPTGKPPGSSGWRMGDPTLGIDGLQTLVLKAGPEGGSRLRVKARGVDLMTPHPPLALPVTVQLQRIGGPCWESRFDADGILRNDPSGFKGKSQ